MASTQRDWFAELEEEDSDLFATDSEDEEFVPSHESESEQYISDNSEIDFVEEEIRENIAADPNVLLLSKDKAIQYALEEPAVNNFRRNYSSVFRGNSGPSLYASSRCTDILSAFLLFVEPLEKKIVEMTNLYGMRKYKEKWNPVDIICMLAYYGLLLLAGVYRSHGECITELWNDRTGRAIFRATMALKRFKEISSCLWFDDCEERSESRFRDKLAPVRYVFDKWVHQLKLMYTPGKNITVDEELLPFRGRCPLTQYIPSKPHKYGIKHWIACNAETFYVYNVDIYCGRDRNCRTEINQGERVVLQLTEGLNGRNITCDNFFTSHHLATALKQRQMTLVGTIRKNRKEIPPLLVDMKRKRRYHSEFVFDHYLPATLVSYVPKENRFVTLLSTMHTKIEINNDDKNKPEIINFYNSTKGGVDAMDEMVGTYTCKRKVNRWPVAVFCNMLDISALNAFIIYIALNPQWNYSKKKFRRRLFLIELGNMLVQPLIERRDRMPRGVNAAALVSEIQGNPVPEAPPDNEPNTSRHGLTHSTPTRKRARCHMCPSLPNANVHSVRCDKCFKPFYFMRKV